jgi:hypothetical protein
MSKLLVDEISDADNTGPVTVTDGLTVQGAFTSLGIDDNATSTAMTLDASGNLLVGKTSSSATTQGIEARADGRLWVSTSSDDSIFNRAGTDGGILSFRKNGTTVGSIGTTGGDIGLTTSANARSVYIGGANSGGSARYLNFDLDVQAGGSSSGNEGGAFFSSVDDVTDLGTASNRFNDLYLSGGVYLGGTGSANKLDDYEEGTFAPTFTPDTSGSLPLQSAYDTMQYVKIGNWVTLSGFIRAATPSSPVGSSPNLGNFPFTVADLSDAAGRSSGSVSYFDDSAGNWSVLPCYIIESQTQAYVKIDSSTIGNNDGFYISLNYRTT